MAIHYKAREYNTSAPGANTNILAANISPSFDGSAFRVTVALTTASIFNVFCTDGSTPHVWGLNSSVALGAADIHTFTFSAPKSNGTTDQSYNFQVETDGVIEILAVEEILGEAL